MIQFIPSLVTETIHYCQKPLELNFNMNMKNHLEFLHSENTDLAEWAKNITLNFHLENEIRNMSMGF